MITIENKIPFATTNTNNTTNNTRCCSFCSKPGHDIRNCNDILIEDLTKKQPQESKRREKLLKTIDIANDINNMMTFSKKLVLR